MSNDFTPDQKRFLEGFASGLNAARAARGVAGKGQDAAGGPDAPHLEAQERATAAGGKLAEQEKFKREQHPFDAYARLNEQARNNEPPKPADDFRWRYFGLFYAAPAQASYMCRLRIANGILTHWQFEGLAGLADRYAGPYAHVTTRANLQLREIEPRNAVAVIEGIQDLGLCSRGTGADNIRNVTGTPTAGIDPQELIDTRPYARAWHFHILNDRTLFGLPRKFNVAFDGAGTIAALEDTNDIGFQAVAVREGFGVAPGVWFRLMLGGITGHRDFARDTGIVVRPEETTRVADAIVRVFIAHGDRTNRNKARLKYLLDAWGFEKFLKAVEELLGAPLTRVPAEAVEPRPAFDPRAHIGVQPQKQAGLNWLGIALPAGALTTDQMRGLARIARELGDGDIRLTVWQNLLVSGVADANVAPAEAAIAALGLATRTTAIRSGLVACTGNQGCRFAASDTKGHAEDIARHCEARVPLASPVNIHLTGCHHSCAQHYIGDIGLIGARVAASDDDTVEGYHIFVGGGFGPDAAIGRELYRDVKATDAPITIARMLRGYLTHREGGETFLAFTRRHDTAALKAIFDTEPVE
ncbi:MAG: NirA family protein [Pseudorhodoplanes sp.]|nr:NirA family protein [Pseudorhodoplanes sp.]